MRLIGNALNDCYLPDVAKEADVPSLEHIHLAVAYVAKLDDIFDLALKRNVPITLFALADGFRFPHIEVLKRFVEASRPSWQLYLTRNYYHPKIMWFRGVGAYFGSANLTDAGWFRNLECGIWMTDSELAARNWDEELLAMFSVIKSRSAAARREDLEAYRRLAKRRQAVNDAERQFQNEVDRELGHIPGGMPPADRTTRQANGSAAKRAFIAEWNNGLTILRKLVDMVKEVEWPAWVDSTIPPAIAQDQATEYWYSRNVPRHGGDTDSRTKIEELHAHNRRAPEAAVQRMFAEWSVFEGDDEWTYWTNESPALLAKLLSRAELGNLDEERLKTVLFNCHAARERARQIDKETFGIAEHESATKEARSGLFAKFLLQQRSKANRSVQDLLLYVLWGDKDTPDFLERIWNGAHSDDWKIPNVGESILGELFGYARPEVSPPRNGRVAKALTALGFDGLSY